MSIEVQPGWTKTKLTSLEGDFPEFVYRHVGGGFRVMADHRGVQIKGNSLFFTTHGDYDNFAWVLGDAAKEATSLRRAKIAAVGDNELRVITGGK